MIPALTLVVVVLLAGVSSETGLLGALALAAAAVVWLLVDNPVEGKVLWTVTSHHGLTGADLAGLAAFAIAVWRIYTAVRRRRASRTGSS